MAAGVGMHLVSKRLIGRMLARLQRASLQRALQQSYPVLTGVTPGQSTANIGELLRSAMIGAGTPTY
jgi:hypothetical protein